MKIQYTFTYAFVVSLLLVACSDKEPRPRSDQTTSDTYDTELVLNIYNWPDYIADDIIEDFESDTDVAIDYQTFESNESLHAKMVAGNTGYDIVVPSSSFAKQHIDAGYLQPLDKSLIPNLSNLDPVFMQKLENIDPGNQYLVPWAWGYTTVGINKTKLQKALGDTPMPENAWDLVFDPTYTSKAKSCGIAFLDSPTEVFQPALHYLGKDPYSNNPEDYREAGAMLAKVRGDIRAFSSTIINDLGSGKYCVVLGWSGDINLAAEVAKEAGSEDNIQVLLPSTGAIMFLDTMAIPKDAAHPKNAAAFINFYLEPEQAARQINEMRYPTGNLEVQGLLDPSIKDDNTIVLSTEDFAKLVPPGFYNNQARQTMVDVFTEFKKGNG